MTNLKSTFLKVLVIGSLFKLTHHTKSTFWGHRERESLMSWLGLHQDLWYIEAFRLLHYWVTFLFQKNLFISIPKQCQVPKNIGFKNKISKSLPKLSFKSHTRPKFGKMSTFGYKESQKWGFCGRVEEGKVQKVHSLGPKGPLLGVSHPPRFDPGYGPVTHCF